MWAEHLIFDSTKDIYKSIVLSFVLVSTKLLTACYSCKDIFLPKSGLFKCKSKINEKTISACTWIRSDVLGNFKDN